MSHKLSKSDKAVLQSIGYTKDDFPQIQRALSRTDFLLTDPNGRKTITAEEALVLLGQKSFLSGLGRSAFHRSASREMSDSTCVVSFDSSKLWRLN